MSRRTEQVGQIIKREVSAVIMRDLHDPRIGFITVTHVKVSPDLRHAKIFVSVLGAEAERDRNLDALRNALGYIRRKIAGKIDLRYAPELSLAYDDTEEVAERIEKKLDELKQELGSGEGSPEL